MAAPAKYEGIYDWTYAGGTFEVHLRPGGRFFAPKYQANASWAIIEGKLHVDWAKYGKYQLAITNESPPAFEGSLATDEKNWRKMALNRPFSVADVKLLDSVWEWEHAGGKFEVQFMGDAYNHFVCKDYPAHSHWSQTANTVFIEWDKFGQYEMVLADDGESMAGSLKGSPDKWRKAVRKGSADGSDHASCDHHH